LKDIILPWTCETGDKIKRVIKWIFLITAPIAFIHIWIIWDSIKDQPATGIYLFEFVYGVFGTIIGWIFEFFCLAINDKLPNFRCKCDK